MNFPLLYSEADRSAGSLLIERLGKLHEDRLAMGAAGDHRAAVRDARLIQDLVETATVSQLRAAVVQLTTPELRPVLPVVVGRPS